MDDDDRVTDLIAQIQDIRDGARHHQFQHQQGTFQTSDSTTYDYIYQGSDLRIMIFNCLDDRRLISRLNRVYQQKWDNLSLLYRCQCRRYKCSLTLVWEDTLYLNYQRLQKAEGVGYSERRYAPIKCPDCSHRHRCPRPDANLSDSDDDWHPTESDYDYYYTPDSE